MIRFSLTCADGHGFDSWFQSSDAFETLKASGHLSCVICGTARIEKAMMAPAVSSRDGVSVPLKQSEPSTAEQAITAMRKHVEEHSDYVGLEFAREARAMHVGDIPERAIFGEARPDEAKALIEDGIPVAPLPFLPSKKTN